MAGGPEMVSLGTGAPNPSLFPFKRILVETKDGGKVEFTGPELSASLQYGPSAGDAALVSWLGDLQRKMHSPQTDVSLIVTPGSQDGLAMLFSALLNKGDSVLIENPTYTGTLNGVRDTSPETCLDTVGIELRPMGVKMLGVETDEDGLRPDILKDVLLSATDSKPKILLLQPGPLNPTGRSVTLERRKAILDIANQHDLLIIEDDPYFYLNFQPPPPSFLSLDTEGRVIRTDSFSKILSSGFRLGFVTGPKPIIDRLILHLQVTSMHASSLSQAIVRELLQGWGTDGFLEHSKKVSSFYEGQCSAMVEAAGEELGGEAEWARPTGGMFLWIRALQVPDTAALINTHALANKVVLAPGNVFFTDPSKPCPFLRASYSNVTHQQMREVVSGPS